MASVGPFWTPLGPPFRFLNRHELVSRLFPQACVNRGVFHEHSPHTHFEHSPHFPPRSFEHSPHTYI